MPCPYFVVWSWDKKLTTEDTKEILHKAHRESGGETCFALFVNFVQSLCVLCGKNYLTEFSLLFFALVLNCVNIIKIVR